MLVITLQTLDTTWTVFSYTPRQHKFNEFEEYYSSNEYDPFAPGGDF